jgi:hypothetical protein
LRPEAAIRSEALHRHDTPSDPCSQLELLRERKRVINFNTETTNCALKLTVARPSSYKMMLLRFL